MLFGPLTGLEARSNSIQGATRFLHFRPTVNRSGIMMEDLVKQRQLLHIKTTEVLQAELKGGSTPAPALLLQQLERHAEFLRNADTAVFNTDASYKAVSDSSVDLKATLSMASEAAATLAEEDGASDEAMVAAQAFLLQDIDALVYMGGSADASLTLDTMNDESRAQRLEEAATETKRRAVLVEEVSASYATLSAGEREGLGAGLGLLLNSALEVGVDAAMADAGKYSALAKTARRWRNFGTGVSKAFNSLRAAAIEGRERRVEKEPEMEMEMEMEMPVAASAASSAASSPRAAGDFRQELQAANGGGELFGSDDDSDDDTVTTALAPAPKNAAPAAEKAAAVEMPMAAAAIEMPMAAAAVEMAPATTKTSAITAIKPNLAQTQSYHEDQAEGPGDAGADKKSSRLKAAPASIREADAAKEAARVEVEAEAAAKDAMAARQAVEFGAKELAAAEPAPVAAAAALAEPPALMEAAAPSAPSEAVEVALEEAAPSMFAEAAPSMEASPVKADVKADVKAEDY